jgi:hypothetical protein
VHPGHDLRGLEPPKLGGQARGQAPGLEQGAVAPVEEECAAVLESGAEIGQGGLLCALLGKKLPRVVASSGDAMLPLPGKARVPKSIEKDNEKLYREPLA